MKGGLTHMKKHLYLFVLLIAGIFIGNQVFNHVHAWLGIAMIAATVIFFFYRLTKIIKNENID